ncbi:MAG: NADPH-dependent F420 reductase [Anaerolineales bacterium]|jgi:NADPH-dependent F420 reductase
MTEHLLFTLAIVGGTGPEGTGLGMRWARAGYRVIIGSRSAEKAEAHAARLNERLGESGLVRGMVNLQAARRADLVVLTVPYAGHRQTLEAIAPMLKNKILLDVTVPLNSPDVTRVKMPPAGSAAQEAREILGPEVRVVSGFHNVAQAQLEDPDSPLACDVFVCGDDPAAKTQVMELVEAAGARGWDAGPLDNSVVSEGLTSVLIGINKRFRVDSSGIQVVGVPR